MNHTGSVAKVVVLVCEAAERHGHYIHHVRYYSLVAEASAGGRTLSLITQGTAARTLQSLCGKERCFRKIVARELKSHLPLVEARHRRAKMNTIILAISKATDFCIHISTDGGPVAKAQTLVTKI